MSEQAGYYNAGSWPNIRVCWEWVKYYIPSKVNRRLRLTVVPFIEKKVYPRVEPFRYSPFSSRPNIMSASSD